jgi:hypothetical protein
MRATVCEVDSKNDCGGGVIVGSAAAGVGDNVQLTVLRLECMYVLSAHLRLTCARQKSSSLEWGRERERERSRQESQP